MGNSLVGIAEIIVAKHRNGPTGIANMRFDGEYARFQNLDDYAVGRNYVELPSKMNKSFKPNESVEYKNSTGNALSDEPLPF